MLLKQVIIQSALFQKMKMENLKYLLSPVFQVMQDLEMDLRTQLNGGVVVADIGNARVRLIIDGMVSTIAGNGESGSMDGIPSEATFKYAMDIVSFGEIIYMADAGSHLIRKIIPGEGVSTFSLQDTLSTPHGIAVDSDGNIYIADMGTHRILKVNKDRMVTPIAGTGKEGQGLLDLNKPAAVLVHANYLWIADLNNHQIKVLELSK